MLRPLILVTRRSWAEGEERHKTVRKPLEITPTAFLSCLEQLDQDERYLLSCLEALKEQLQSGGWLTDCKRGQHPTMTEAAYVSSRGGSQRQGVVYIPIWLVNDIQSGQSLVKSRVKLMIEDVQQRVIDLTHYRSNEEVIPDEERKMFLGCSQSRALIRMRPRKKIG